MHKKTIFFILISHALFLSCKKEIPSTVQTPCELDINAAMERYYDLVDDNNPNNDPAQPPRACDVPVREPGANLSFHVELTDFNPDQEAKMMDALERAKIALNSAEFKRRVYEHTYNGEKTFVDNGGKTNEEVYESIMKAAETLFPEEDEEMDLDITLYEKNNSTVGYTYPDTVRIWVNNKFFKNYTLGEVAANAVHEWTHKLGYDHSYYNNQERPYSVPYGVGTIIKEMVNGM